MALAPLAVALPILAAAVIAIGVTRIPRVAADALGLAVAAAVTVLCVLVLIQVADGTGVYWSGGWEPRQGVALGVAFGIDTIGAGLAAFVALLTAAAFAFAWHYVDTERPYYHVLMLVLLAGMVGFCFSADLFNIFVFLELMSVSAYALAGYKSDERAPIEGSLNFAVTNSIGSFLVVAAIALIYGRTGALNLAQIGDALAGRPVDGLVVVAFALLCAGFFVKAGVVPFHFWLADAYAVAPASVCMIFAAAMSELGIYAVARIYFASFSEALGAPAGLTAVLLVAGATTALVGAVMSYRQDHLKRLLAFSTVSYIGLFLIGLALLDGEGAAGTAVYVIGDGFAKALLFACVGILQHRFGSVSERRLRGRGRELRLVGYLFAIGGLAVAALPPFGPFLGKAMIEDALIGSGHGWAVAVIVACSVLCGAAVLRAAGRIFLGWGRKEPEKVSPADRETEIESAAVKEGAPPLMLLIAALLATLCLASGVWFGLADSAARAGEHFANGPAYERTILEGAETPASDAGSAAPTWYDWLLGSGSALGAALLAFWVLQGSRPGIGVSIARRAERVLTPLEAAHSGHVGDYVAWLVAGTAALGGGFALAL